MRNAGSQLGHSLTCQAFMLLQPWTHALVNQSDRAMLILAFLNIVLSAEKVPPSSRIDQDSSRNPHYSW